MNKRIVSSPLLLLIVVAALLACIFIIGYEVFRSIQPEYLTVQSTLTDIRISGDNTIATLYFDNGQVVPLAGLDNIANLRISSTYSFNFSHYRTRPYNIVNYTEIQTGGK